MREEQDRENSSESEFIQHIEILKNLDVPINDPQISRWFPPEIPPENPSKISPENPPPKNLPNIVTKYATLPEATNNEEITNFAKNSIKFLPIVQLTTPTIYRNFVICCETQSFGGNILWCIFERISSFYDGDESKFKEFMKILKFVVFFYEQCENETHVWGLKKISIKNVLNKKMDIFTRVKKLRPLVLIKSDDPYTPNKC